MEKKVVFIIFIILLIGGFFLYSSDSKHKLIRRFHEEAMKFVPQKNIPEEKNHPALMKKLDLYLPALVKFELIVKTHMPMENVIQQTLMDSLSIEPDSLMVFIQSIDSLNTKEIKVFYRKLQQILDTIPMPDSIRVKITREQRQKLTGPNIHWVKP